MILFTLFSCFPNAETLDLRPMSVERELEINENPFYPPGTSVMKHYRIQLATVSAWHMDSIFHVAFLLGDFTSMSTLTEFLQILVLTSGVADNP